jgi:hypothetical protein
MVFRVRGYLPHQYKGIKFLQENWLKVLKFGGHIRISIRGQFILAQKKKDSTYFDDFGDLECRNDR